jgi:nucleoside-diphosphate-sugar epimerase
MGNGGCAGALGNLANAAALAPREEARMADESPILVTGAAGRLGAVGRSVTELLLARGLSGRAMARGETTGPPWQARHELAAAAAIAAARRR